MTGHPYRIGIDLGGSKIETVVLDAADQVRFRRRVATPSGDYPATLDAVADLVSQAEEQIGETASVGIGTPGSLSPRSGLMRNANSTCLNGKPLKHDLEQHLGRPIRMANDANCFTLSEAVDGAARGHHAVFGVIIGTGVGGGIVIDGQLLNGANAIGGEWGHNPLPAPEADGQPAPECYCGRRSCIETYLSGPALEQQYQQRAGRRLDVPGLAHAAASGDAAAERCLQVYEERLARSLATVINLLDPDAIVLGGGLSNLQRLYRNIPTLWSPHIFSDCVSTVLLAPQHGDASGVRGAARLWPALKGD